MSNYSGQSEYTGDDYTAIGIPGRDHLGEEVLPAADKLRAVYLTGTEDPAAPVDRASFEGGSNVPSGGS